MQGRAQSRQAVLAAVTPTKLATRAVQPCPDSPDPPQSHNRRRRTIRICSRARMAKVRVSRLDAAARLAADRLAGGLHDSLAGRQTGRAGVL